MEKSSKKFIIDTSAFLSMESINLLDMILNNFDLITTDLVINELEVFGRYNDHLGSIAKIILKKKRKFIIKNTEIK